MLCNNNTLFVCLIKNKLSYCQYKKNVFFEDKLYHRKKMILFYIYNHLYIKYVL